MLVVKLSRVVMVEYSCVGSQVESSCDVRVEL